MKNLFGATAAALLLSAASHSFAEGGYIGGQYAQTTYEQTGSTLDGEAEPNSLILLGGYEFTDHWAIEGRVGLGMGDDEYVTGTNMELDKLVSVLGKLSLGGTVSPYLLLGFSDVELTTNNAGTAEGNGVSFGAGIDFSVSENVAIGLEYISYVDEDAVGGGEAKLSAVSLGVNYKF
jgi:opacity protein-like surface antigen